MIEHGTATTKFSPPSRATLFEQSARDIQPLENGLIQNSWHHRWYSLFDKDSNNNVLDGSYVPHNKKEMGLFQEKQKYEISLYHFGDQKIKTNSDKSIVCKYDQNYDVCSVCLKLCEYHTKSTKTVMSAAALLCCITSERLGTGQCKSPCRRVHHTF